MIADAHFHLDLLSMEEQCSILENHIHGAHRNFLGLCAGVWPQETLAFLQNKHLGSMLQQDEAGVYFAAGLHPAELHRRSSPMSWEQDLEAPLALLEHMAQTRSIAAIGETGFDLSKGVVEEARSRGFDKATLVDMQWTAFCRCLDVARRHHLPLILHSRAAWAQTLRAIDRVVGDPGGSELQQPKVMIHCYPGPPNDVEPLTKKGVYLSFGGVLTWTTARRMRESLLLCPLERLLLETDSPDLAPVLASGQRPDSNSPRHWPWIASVVADLRCEPCQELVGQAHDNLLRFLGRANQRDNNSPQMHLAKQP
jgi:TatD DNase family protein